MTHSDNPTNSTEKSKSESAYHFQPNLRSASGLESQVTTNPLPVDFETICNHEAAHAVMRWVRGLPCTMIEADEHGGYCHGSGRRISAETALLITLAGFTVEMGYGLGKPMFATAQADDIDKARELLRDHQYLREYFFIHEPDGTRLFFEGDRLLEKWFDRACEILSPFSGVIEYLGWRLELCGTMSARSVAATIRELMKKHDNDRL